MPVLSARDDNASTMRPIYIAGFAVVGAIVLAVSIWLAIRFYSLKKRDNMRNAAFLTVKGLVRDDDDLEKDFTTNSFSRAHLTRSVVLPDRAPSATPQEIAEFHRQSGNFPRPFAPSKPFSLAPPDRSSLFSTGSGSRLSVLSTTSSTSPTSTRKVRQTYTPILPDELLIAPSERLMVVQSFDDGWCVVGRPLPLPNHASQPKSLFKTPFPSPPADVELGVVPAWCFLKHIKAERPVRSSSLGITVQVDGPGVKRDDLVSWSNF